MKTELAFYMPFLDPDEAARQLFMSTTTGHGGIREPVTFPRLNSRAAIFVRYDSLFDSENGGRSHLPGQEKVHDPWWAECSGMGANERSSRPVKHPCKNASVVLLLPQD